MQKPKAAIPAAFAVMQNSSLEMVRRAHSEASARVEIKSGSNRSGSLHNGQIDLQRRSFQVRNYADKVIQRGRNRCSIAETLDVLGLLKGFRSEDQSSFRRAFHNKSSGAKETSLPTLTAILTVSGIASDAQDRGIRDLLTEAQDKGKALDLSNGLGGDDEEVGVLIGRDSQQVEFPSKGRARNRTHADRRSGQWCRLQWPEPTWF